MAVAHEFGHTAGLVHEVGTDDEGLSGLEIQFESRLSGQQGRLVVGLDGGGSIAAVASSS